MASDLTANNGTGGGMSPVNVEWIWMCKIIIVVVGLVGNILVIATILSSRKLRGQSPYVLICSLSVVVLYALIFVIPFDINSTLVGNWPDHLHPKFCAFNAVSAMFFYGSTALNTAMVVLDRYFATVWYSYRILNSKLTLGILLAVCYFVPLVCLVPFFVNVQSGFDPKSMSCFVTGEWKYGRFAWTVSFLGFSLLLMIYCFAHIFVDICRKKHALLSIAEDEESTREVKQLRRYFSEVKTVKVSGVLFLLMLLRLPSMVAPILVPRTAFFVTMNSTLIIGISTIMFYPFVYVLLSRDFRQAAKRLVCCQCSPGDNDGYHVPTVNAEECERNSDTHL